MGFFGYLSYCTKPKIMLHDLTFYETLMFRAKSNRSVLHSAIGDTFIKGWNKAGENCIVYHCLNDTIKSFLEKN